MASEQVVIFQMAAQEYAIPISQVKEIIRYNGATKVPNTPDYVDGIINLRGKVLSVIDLARKCALQTQNSSHKQALIVEAAGQDVGLVVDAVTEVIWLDEAAIEATNGISHSDQFISSIGKLDNRLIMIIDLSKLFN